MAAIDVVFTGLMLICLNGDPDCPVGTLGNTAWVVQADGKSMPCGYADETVTTLVLRFSKEAFTISGPLSDTCTKDADDADKIGCVFRLPPQDICVLPKPKPFGRQQQLDNNLSWLPSIDEVDQRFKTFNARILRSPAFVPTRIHFPDGAIAAGAKWPPGQLPRQWGYSNGGEMPSRTLSDRLKVSYENAHTLELTDCRVDTLLVLQRSPASNSGEVEFLNRADKLEANQVGNYNELSYLLWYYELGIWDTESGACPAYTGNAKGAVVLRCSRGSTDVYCASFTGDPDRVSTVWPPKRPRRPRPEVE